jgi:hypothetical protein
MSNSYLPWLNLEAQNIEDQNTRILKMKEEFWGSKLLLGLPPVIQELGKLITGLDAKAEPDYD